jgi:hypothetical protein
MATDSAWLCLDYSASASGSHTRHAKIAPFRAPGKNTAMDIERINQIGGMLTDLATRTEALRGYL